MFSDHTAHKVFLAAFALHLSQSSNFTFDCFLAPYELCIPCLWRFFSALNVALIKIISALKQMTTHLLYFIFL